MSFRVQSFETHALAATSGLDVVNVTDLKASLRVHDPEDPNVNIEFEPCVLTHSEGKAFEDDIRTSSFIKEISAASSDEVHEKSRNILTSAAKDSAASTSLIFEK